MVIQRNGCNFAVGSYLGDGWRCSETNKMCNFSWPCASECAQKYGLGPLKDEIWKEKKDGKDGE